MLLTMAILFLQPDGVKPNCDGNTLEVNACLGEKAKASKERLQKYLNAAVSREVDNAKRDSVVLGIRASQRVFEAYRDVECSTVYEDWKTGTVRTAMSLRCSTRLTDERTHTIWSHWLRYVDRTPPILPEPKPTP